MTRRNLVTTASAAVLAGGAAVAAPAKKKLIEIRRYQLRNGAVNQRQIDQVMRHTTPQSLLHQPDFHRGP